MSGTATGRGHQTARMAEAILILVGVYLVCGAIFAGVFLARGLRRVDHATQGSPLGFYVLIFPGVAALWPLMLAKWRRAGGHP